MANPQKENGYTPIANEILEEVARRKFSGSQFRILMAIWRLTYGFQRKSHAISLNLLVEKTGLNKDTVKQQIKKLYDNKVIVIVKEATFNSPREIGFNKNYDEWLIPRDDAQGDDEHTGGQITPSRSNTTPTGGQMTPPTGGQMTPYRKKKKESIKENIKESGGGDLIDARVGRLFKMFHDQFISRNPTQDEKLSGYLDDGLEPELIERAILITRENGKDISYLWGILNKFIERGLTSLDQYEQYERERKRRRELDGTRNQEPRGHPKASGDDETASRGYYAGLGIGKRL